VNSRNGERHRDYDTRAGTIDLAVPKLREGSYFPGWLLEPRRRAERALTQVVCQWYVEGVTTRRVDQRHHVVAAEAFARERHDKQRAQERLEEELRALGTALLSVGVHPGNAGGPSMHGGTRERPRW
jgi:putative transposase